MSAPDEKRTALHETMPVAEPAGRGGDSDVAPVLRLRNVRKHFSVGGRGFGRAPATVKALDGIDIEISPGETLSLVGESGSGKTTTARTILMLETPTEGSIEFRGAPVTTLSRQGMKAYRRAVQAVFQDPLSSLNPRMTIGWSVGEPLKAAESNLRRSEHRARVREALGEVGLGDDYLDRYPHELSGGQRQRAAIARALVTRPDVIVLDEPVSALDVSIRAQIINLLKDLQDRLGVAYVLIAHDLAVVRFVSSHVGVMYLGKLVESGTKDDVYAQPLHPYTQVLMSNALPSHPDMQHEVTILSGEVPSPLNPPSGCSFHTRCPMAMAVCAQIEPQLAVHGNGQKVACHLYGPATENAE